MELRPFIIVALPFANSTLTSEYTIYAKSEDDALEQFQKRYPAWQVKEVREQ
jgi:hypothetical protein